MENLISIIFPEKCVGCGTLSGPICKRCQKKLAILREQYCVFCGRRSVSGKTHFNCNGVNVPELLYSCLEYSGFVRECVHQSKYESHQFSILRRLFDFACEPDLFFNFISSDFLVVPIPLHKKKLQQRGFNQSEVVASALCKKIGLKMQSNLLVRERYTEKQHEKDRKARFLNLEGAFCADAQKSRGKKVLLVDDVCTTGATFISASKSLYQVGASCVYCFALCRTPLML